MSTITTDNARTIRAWEKARRYGHITAIIDNAHNRATYCPPGHPVEPMTTPDDMAGRYLQVPANHNGAPRPWATFATR